MNSDNTNQPPSSDNVQQPPAALPVAKEHSKPIDVPVFNCLVYVSPVATGGVRGRVANLPGIEFVAANERAALGKIVPAFKQRITELMQSGTPIPWIEPPSPAEANEQKRFIPVHL